MIELHKIYTDLISWIAVSVIGGMVGWIVTLRRKVNTNEKKVSMLESEIRHRDKMREEDRERMSRVEADVRDIKVAILGKNS